MFRLEFGTAPSAEPGAPPVTTNDILSMISPEGESVPLLKVRVHLPVISVYHRYTYLLCIFSYVYSKLRLAVMLRTG